MTSRWNLVVGFVNSFFGFPLAGAAAVELPAEGAAVWDRTNDPEETKDGEAASAGVVGLAAAIPPPPLDALLTLDVDVLWLERPEEGTAPVEVSRRGMGTPDEA